MNSSFGPVTQGRSIGSYLVISRLSVRTLALPMMTLRTSASRMVSTLAQTRCADATNWPAVSAA